ncbi:YifB family Mg chelatase-like AAA ATPase [Nocardioides perillae]|uniref:Magnesium chelatase family protein n=1 Tax=Nocardioides perillae TaxID=1119534 RepID=A0A7Y9UNE7_9ACTN|nr:ATP-binding protein [Nocardioides perillae]NYG56381.1 magnesium chelatase family protein [Nocardioides perillae]
MPWACARTVALAGSVGHVVDVQADVSQGMVGTTLVGCGDAALQEGRDRVRTAVGNTAGVGWPATRRVTVLLSPAGLPKRGTHFDLAVAVSVLCAAGDVPRSALAGTVFVGELGLDAGLRPATGVLPMVMVARDHGLRRVVVPEPQAVEAAMVPGTEVLGVRSLAQVLALLRGEEVPDAPPVVEPSGLSLLAWRGQDRGDEVDLADLVGMREARYAVEVAAAGGHHLLLSGPQGAGKTSLAERLPGLLPDLDDEEALELTAVRSLAGTLVPGEGLVRRPPYESLHHSATRASVLGGGTGTVAPGAVSRTHAGVLVLDEFPLLAADVVEGLRDPLESGEVTLARGDQTATYPARGMVVLAANPCPCGRWHPTAAGNGCRCAETRRRDYRRKLEGPVVDRVDVVCHLAASAGGEDALEPPESTAAVRARVTAARARQARRWAGRRWRLNAHVPGAVLSAEHPLPADARRLVGAALQDGSLTRRGAVRVHRLAWTVADLRGVHRPEAVDVEVALALRRGTALPAWVVQPGAAPADVGPDLDDLPETVGDLVDGRADDRAGGEDPSSPAVHAALAHLEARR